MPPLTRSSTLLPKRPVPSPQHLRGLPHREDRAEQKDPPPRSEQENSAPGRGEPGWANGGLPMGLEPHRKDCKSYQPLLTSTTRNASKSFYTPPSRGGMGVKHRAVSRPGNRGEYTIFRWIIDSAMIDKSRFPDAMATLYHPLPRLVGKLTPRNSSRRVLPEHQTLFCGLYSR